MKVLKYILVIVIILLVVFFGNGLLHPEISYGSQITVNKPVEEAWAVMSDGDRITEWLKEIDRIEPVSGEENTVGAVSKIYASQDGEEWVMEETITSVTTNEHMAMTFKMDFMDMDYSMSFKQEGDKTVISSNSVVKGNGLFAQSMVSFMGGTMQEQEEKNMNNLKSVIESNSIDYFKEKNELPVEVDSMVVDPITEN